MSVTEPTIRRGWRYYYIIAQTIEGRAAAMSVTEPTIRRGWRCYYIIAQTIEGRAAAIYCMRRYLPSILLDRWQDSGQYTTFWGELYGSREYKTLINNVTCMSICHPHHGYMPHRPWQNVTHQGLYMPPTPWQYATHNGYMSLTKAICHPHQVYVTTPWLYATHTMAINVKHIVNLGHNQ